MIAPGELHGIDIEPSQVEMAKRHAQERNVGNAFFRVAEAAALPFEDGYFDLVHCNDVLLYIPDTAAVLAEVMRVLRPDGVLACRDVIVESCFANPHMGILQRGWEMFGDLLAADDAHPQMGKDLKLHLTRAGFVDIRMSGSLEVFDTPEELDVFYKIVMGWFLSADIKDAMNKYGAATERLLHQIEQAMERWRREPGALAALAYGHGVARRP